MNMVPSSTQSALEEQIWNQLHSVESQWMYAVLDGAQGPEVVRSLSESYTRYQSLYEGDLHSAITEVSPYLIRLRKGTQYTQWLIEQCLTKNWGIFFTSSSSFSETRKHLRRFLRVKTEEGKTLVFRWYDPRVLHMYLPTCTIDELEYVFGPIDTFIVKSNSDYCYTTYTIEDDTVAIKEYTVLMSDALTNPKEMVCN